MNGGHRGNLLCRVEGPCEEEEAALHSQARDPGPALCCAGHCGCEEHCGKTSRVLEHLSLLGSKGRTWLGHGESWLIVTLPWPHVFSEPQCSHPGKNQEHPSIAITHNTDTLHAQAGNTPRDDLRDSRAHQLERPDVALSC